MNVQAEPFDYDSLKSKDISILEEFGGEYSSDDLHDVYDLMDQLSTDSPVEYPWNLEELGNVKSILLFGYGSLVNVESAMSSYQYSNFDEAIYSVAFGLKRQFDYVMPPRLLEKRGISKDSTAIAALNTVATYKAGSMTNGVIVKLDTRDLESLREREVGYDLVPVSCLGWNTSSKRPIKAFAFAASPSTEHGAKVVSKKITPEPIYVNICCEAFEKVSQQFLGLFKKSTFLADGVGQAFD